MTSLDDHLPDAKKMVASIKSALRLSQSEAAMLLGDHDRAKEIAVALAPHAMFIRAHPGRISHRAINGRRTLLDELASGADAEVAINKLVAMLQSEQAQRDRLLTRLTNVNRQSPDEWL